MLYSSHDKTARRLARVVLVKVREHLGDGGVDRRSVRLSLAFCAKRRA